MEPGPYLVLGGYATAPVQGSRADEIGFYSRLLSPISSSSSSTASPFTVGLEIPFFLNGSVHKNGDEELVLNALNEAGSPFSILTLVPGTMQALAQNKHFGLASDDVTGRSQAIAFVKQANEALIRINKKLGRNAIVAVEILSAPSRYIEEVSSSASSLKESLIEIATSLNWDGAELLIEHCDEGGLLKDVKPQKGFLSFSEELEAINGANATSIAIPNKIGISINWARAVLETRDVSRPLQLIESAGELLRCLIFSGCSESQGLYGSYLDSHMPWETHATGSLLTSEIISKTLATAKKTTKLLVCGVKVTLQPPESTPTERAEVNRAMVEAISKHV
jgi:hypothetical protein